MAWEDALRLFSNNLTNFEREEIKSFSEVFYVNYHDKADQEFLDQGVDNNGFDDD